MLQLLPLQAFSASGLFLLTAWLPSFLMQLTGMAPAAALLLHTANMAVLTCCCLLGGLLADEHGAPSVLLATCAVAAAFAWLAWLMLSTAVLGLAAFAELLLCVLVGLHTGALTSVLTNAFPRGVSC
jgi:MHS family proline/betaine transporter-like MFS transporter